MGMRIQASLYNGPCLRMGSLSTFEPVVVDLNGLVVLLFDARV